MSENTRLAQLLWRSATTIGAHTGPHSDPALLAVQQICDAIAIELAARDGEDYNTIGTDDATVNLADAAAEYERATAAINDAAARGWTPTDE